MTEQEINAARERLMQTLPTLFAGLQEAKGLGIPTLAIAARDKTGGGKMILTINEPEELMKDIGLVVGVSYDLTKDQFNEYEVDKILSQF